MESAASKKTESVSEFDPHWEGCIAWKPLGTKDPQSAAQHENLESNAQYVQLLEKAPD